MNLKFPLEEYFKYHPPITEKRKQLHDRINTESLQIFSGFKLANAMSQPNLVEVIYDRAYQFLEEVCTEPMCYRWALGALIHAKQAALTDLNNRQERIFMFMQQFRMFLNQAVTIQELEEA